jgi:serine/threonine protein kinase
MADLPQSIGPYQLIGKLGAGGMGEVYRALDTRVGRHVALKILPESLANDTERRRRFEQEARLAASLNHPNIMAIYDVGLDHHPPYIVGELVPGESLRAAIDKGALVPRKAADMAARIAAGLAAAHAAGIVHRDLKPENVILTPEGSAKILDFGVARMSAKSAGPGETVTLAQTAVGAVIGTAAYMSPEQARGQEVDYRSDQFSLGLVLYEMLSGKQAFARPSAVQTMAAIVENDPPPLERPIPTQLGWILERCLAKERESRYESTRDLARELGQLRDRFGEITTTGTNTQPAVSKPRRRTWTIAVPIAAALGALASWMGSTWLRDPATVNLSNYHLTPFATAMTMQQLPSWSPDGKNIAFLARNELEDLQLYVQAVDGATAVRVNGPDVQLNPGISPFWLPTRRRSISDASARAFPAFAVFPRAAAKR